MLQHLKRITSVVFFKAPAYKKLRPVTIEKNMECLELLSGGHVFFAGPDGKNTVYGRGSLFWHREGENTVHRYREDDPYSCYVFEFEVEKKKKICPRVTIPLYTEPLMGFAEEMFRRYHSGESENPAFCAMVYSTLFWYATGPQRNPGESYPEALKNALDFMEHNVSNSLQLSDIAAAAEISKSNLFTIFRHYLKTSPHKYLLKLRLNRAKQLLAAGERSIKEIAFDCGFESLEVFYRQFSANENATPGAYRKRFCILEQD